MCFFIECPFIGFVKSITKPTSILSLVWFIPKTISNWAKKRVFLLRLICFWIAVYWCSKIFQVSYMKYETAMDAVVAHPIGHSFWWNRCKSTKWSVWRLSFFIAIKYVFVGICLRFALWAVTLIRRDLWIPYENVILFDSTTCNPMYIVQHKVFVTDMNANVHFDFHLHIFKVPHRWLAYVYLKLTATAISYAKLLMTKWHWVNWELYSNKLLGQYMNRKLDGTEYLNGIRTVCVCVPISSLANLFHYALSP